MSSTGLAHFIFTSLFHRGGHTNISKWNMHVHGVQRARKSMVFVIKYAHLLRRHCWFSKRTGIGSLLWLDAAVGFRDMATVHACNGTDLAASRKMSTMLLRTICRRLKTAQRENGSVLVGGECPWWRDEHRPNYSHSVNFSVVRSIVEWSKPRQ